MRVRTLCLLAGTAVPLILTGSAPAGFTGISTASKPNPWGLLTVNVYAEFDRPDPGDGSGDHMLGVFGTPKHPLRIEVIGGTFYQSPFSGDQPPRCEWCGVFPSIAFDTFVTIGVKYVGYENGHQPEDHMVLTGEWPGFGDSTLETSNAGWAVIALDAQSDPFNPLFSFPGNGQILIGQFSTLDGSAIQGTMLLQFISNGVADEAVVSFLHAIPGPGCLPALALCALTAQRRRIGRAL